MHMVSHASSTLSYRASACSGWGHGQLTGGLQRVQMGFPVPPDRVARGGGVETGLGLGGRGGGVLQGLWEGCVRPPRGVKGWLRCAADVQMGGGKERGE